MSRSYKKTPRCGDTKTTGKKFANRRVRRRPLEEVYNRCSYKKLYEQWDICDYETVGYTFEAYWRSELKWAAWHNQMFKHCINFKEEIPDKKKGLQKMVSAIQRKINLIFSKIFGIICI